MKIKIIGKLLAAWILFCFASGVSAQTNGDENISPILMIGGLSSGCDAGFEKVNNACQKIDLPENAKFFGL